MSECRMVKIIVVGLLAMSLVACQDRPGPNDVLVRADAGVTVGTPVYRGLSVIGHVVQTRAIGDEQWATLQLDSDSLELASLGPVRIRTTGLGAPPRLVVGSELSTPVFGPGGYIRGRPTK